MTLNILLIGSGGREHALAWKIAQSPELGTLYCAPGNPGTSAMAQNIVLDVTDHAAVTAFCHVQNIGLVVVGPEVPLVDGLANTLEAANIPTFGPGKQAAQLEGSKGYTKDLCARMTIPTAAYGRFTDAVSAKTYIQAQGAPIVIKADGLAAGKGVTVAMTMDEALAAIDDCFDGSFGAAGAEVVVEEFLTGEEASFFCICDGETALPFGTAQDHKRVGEGDTGPNTGGMGAYSPAPIMTEARIKQAMDEIIHPTLQGMREAGAPFKGVLYAGLMIEGARMSLIEYNVRFGDPECQVLMMRLQSDIVPILIAATKGTLANVEAQWSDDAAVTIVMAARGYPATPAKGGVIKGLEAAAAIDHAMVFHAGTKPQGADIIANGGRVLNICGQAPTVTQATKRAYQAIDHIQWADGFYRKDIAYRAIERENI